MTEVAVQEIPNCTQRNFPIKTFYSLHTKVCHTFYRQGHCLTTDPMDIKTSKQEKITDADLGNMYLLFDQALVVRSSSSILFFKIDSETGYWQQYKKFDNMRGQIYFIRGNVRIQIVTDEKVYFYMINKETLLPTLENVMYNYMQCSQMMFGARVRFGITFKSNQPGFQIYTRKYFHNFKVQLNTTNYEGAIGENLESSGQYITAVAQQIGIYDNKTFE
jgi:hypothetical protein